MQEKTTLDKKEKSIVELDNLLNNIKFMKSSAKLQKEIFLNNDILQNNKKKSKAQTILELLEGHRSYVVKTKKSKAQQLLDLLDSCKNTLN